MKSPRRLTMTVMPRRKPKSYSLPALWTSYMWMSELKNENTRVMGAIMPCHNPAPARATRPSASGWLIIGFGPGAVSCIVVLGVVTCTLELGAQAAITIDNVTSKPRTRTSFISTSRTVRLSFTCVIAMKRAHCGLLIKSMGVGRIHYTIKPPQSIHITREVCSVI